MQKTVYPAILLFVLSSVSCESRPASNAPLGKIPIEHDGGTVLIPSIISFNGEEWILSDPAPYAATAMGTYCKYQNSYYQNTSLTLSLHEKSSPVEWSLWQYRDFDGKDMVRELYRARIGFAFLNACKDDLRNGSAMQFYANGQVKIISPRVGREMHGECRAFYPNGNLWWEGEHDQGFFLGNKAVFYNEDGSINTEIDTFDEQVKERSRWKHCQSADSCDSIVEFLRKVEEARDLHLQD